MNIILCAFVQARACSRLALCFGIVLTALGGPSHAQAPAGLYYVHVDHLNTPRAIYNAAQQLVWRWDQQEPFGNDSPNENPSGLGTFECNIRFAGQYYDKETNLAYNYFRDFDPGLGRYLAPEPLGVLADISLYQYARDNPLTFFDRDGRQAAAIPIAPAIGGTAAGAGGLLNPAGALAGAAVGGYIAGSLIYPWIEPYLSPVIDACFVDVERRDRRTPRNRCLDAAAAGGRVWDNFCRDVKDPAKRATCWAQGPESEARKRGWCFQNFDR